MNVIDQTPLFWRLVPACCLVAAVASSVRADDEFRVTRDIEFARADETRLALDLYRPLESEDCSLIVWVHGGAWRRGSRASMPLTEIVRAGYAVASVDYRLSPVAPFPAQVYDIKAAIRYLRAHETELRVNADRIAIAGSSAGGHLAALVGVTNGHPALEGTVGEHLDQSSDVHAIVDYYGPTNFLTILSQSTPHGLNVRVPALELLLQGQPEDRPDLARLGSPVFHVDKNDPPLLLLHGDQDPQVPINQSHELQGRYEELGLPVEFEVVHGGAHGGELFYDERRTQVVLAFLERHVKDSESDRRPEYLQYALEHDGDPERGRRLYANHEKLLCTDCHNVTGKEKSGPNLDGIADKFDREQLIREILHPSQSIKPGFEQVTLLTREGLVHVGRIERANQNIHRLIDAKGKQQDIPTDSIETKQVSTVSLMPENLVSSISVEEFADLMAYLRTLTFGVHTGLVAGGEPIEIPRLETPVTFRPIHTPEQSFVNPVWCGALPGTESDLLVIEHQTARIWRLIRDQGPLRMELFLDLSGDTFFSNNQGLMCIAFHPQYETNRRYFLEHEVNEEGEVKTTVVERRADNDGLRDSGAPSRRLLDVVQPAFNHNGGCIEFGPDGMLYIGFGDGGPQEDPPGHSQNPRVFLGSMLRIDVDRTGDDLPYAIPPDNPFLDAHRRDPAIRPETWAFGFREPWRFSFDSETGELYVGDVGQNTFEEVCIVRRGENHGWNVREAFAPFSDEYRREGETYTDPLFAYEHGLGFSVTGGFVYHGSQNASFDGVYIFGDYNTRRVWGLRQHEGVVESVVEIGTAPGGIASFGVDQQGELYLVTYMGTVCHVDLSNTSFP